MAIIVKAWFVDRQMDIQMNHKEMILSYLTD